MRSLGPPSQNKEALRRSRVPILEDEDGDAPMVNSPDTIAALVLDRFHQLRPNHKPLVRDNGVHEWVPLSGIVAEDLSTSSLTCLSLATGMKCLPAAKLPQAQGNVLHDWHAEVLAMRAFNRFLLDECRCILLAGSDSSSPFLRLTGPLAPDVPGSGSSSPAFAWNPSVRLHMYCSEAPCGDASMELTMAAQADASVWAEPVPSSSGESSSGGGDGGDGDGACNPPALAGRAYFSKLGIVRRKPARADAPPTLSKSCSDKLSLKQCTSLLSSLTSLLIEPGNVYIESLILPSTQHSASGCARAFSAGGRMQPVIVASHRSCWSGGYRFQPFRVCTTSLEFVYAKRSVMSRAKSIAPSNLAVALTASGLDEITLGGVLQGRKAFDPRGASFASRREIWALASEVAGLLETSTTGTATGLRGALSASQTYGTIKQLKQLEARRTVKDNVKSEALRGWLPNTGDDTFVL